MRIYIKGEPNISPDEIKYAIRYYMKLLLPKEYYKNFIIKVEFKPINMKGYMNIVEEDEYLPSEFKIILNSNTGRVTQLQTLAHELVHVWQFATGRLIESCPYSFKFKKKRYYISEVDYWDRPHELEAYGREVGMWARYKAHLKDEGIMF